MKDNLSATIDLEFDEETGETILPLSDEILASAGWKEGDMLEWINNNDGTWTLRKNKMPNFTFTCKYDNVDTTFNVQSAVTLTEVVTNFEQFLKGCGYIFDNIEVVNHEDKASGKEYDFGAVDHFWDNSLEKSEHFWDTERNK